MHFIPDQGAVSQLEASVVSTLVALASPITLRDRDNSYIGHSELAPLLINGKRGKIKLNTAAIYLEEDTTINGTLITGEGARVSSGYDVYTQEICVFIDVEIELTNHVENGASHTATLIVATGVTSIFGSSFFYCEKIKLNAETTLILRDVSIVINFEIVAGDGVNSNSQAVTSIILEGATRWPANTIIPPGITLIDRRAQEAR